MALKGHKVVLREKRLEDAAADYVWKKDDEIAKLDASFPLDISFSRYLIDYTEELRYPDSRRWPFAIETLNGKHIGNCSCYDIDKGKKEAELGIIIGDKDFWDKGYGADAVTTLVNHMFQDMGMERIYLHTLDWNTRARKCFEKCGFTSRGQVTRGWHTFILMEIKCNWHEEG